MVKDIKIGLVSDLHLSNSLPHTVVGDSSRSNRMMEFIDKLVQVFKKEKVEIIIVPGDIVNSSKVDPETLYLLLYFLKSVVWVDIPIVFCRGNHDKDGKVSVIDSFKLFSACNFFYPSKDYGWEDFIIKSVMMRAIDHCSHSSFLSIAKKSIRKGKFLSKILIGHIGVKGTLHGSTTSIMGVKKEDIRDLLDIYDLIILGHHHKSQWIIKGRAFYVGSMQQTRKDEINHIPGGYIVSIPENKIVKKIENNFSPRFVKVEGYKYDKKEIENSIVEVIVDTENVSERKNSEFIKSIYKCNPYNVIRPNLKKNKISVSDSLVVNKRDRKKVMKEVIDSINVMSGKKEEYTEYTFNIYSKIESGS